MLDLERELQKLRDGGMECAPLGVLGAVFIARAQ